MKYFLTLLIMISLSVQTLTAQIQTGDFTLQYNDRTITSNIYCYVPADYNPENSYPYIMAWHGAGDTGNNMKNAMKVWLALKIGAILVCPDANSVNGQEGSYFLNLADFAYSNFRSNYNIDTTKMIILGFSWGGGFSYQLGLLNPNLFTGIIGLAPAIGSLNQFMWDNITKIKMATILGTADFNYSAVNSLMNQIKSKGGELHYIVKQGVQHVDNTYFNSQEIKDDFFACYNFVNGTEVVVEEKLIYQHDGICLFPNPFYNELNIAIERDYSSINISVNDLQGKQVLNYFDFKPNNSLVKLRLTELPSGIYFIIVSSENKKYYKIINKI